MKIETKERKEGTARNYGHTDNFSFLVFSYVINNENSILNFSMKMLLIKILQQMKTLLNKLCIFYWFPFIRG